MLTHDYLFLEKRSKSIRQYICTSVVRGCLVTAVNDQVIIVNGSVLADQMARNTSYNSFTYKRRSYQI